jgi:hypothetical protein
MVTLKEHIFAKGQILKTLKEGKEQEQTVEGFFDFVKSNAHQTEHHLTTLAQEKFDSIKQNGQELHNYLLRFKHTVAELEEHRAVSPDTAFDKLLFSLTLTPGQKLTVSAACGADRTVGTLMQRCIELLGRTYTGKTDVTNETKDAHEAAGEVYWQGEEDDVTDDAYWQGGDEGDDPDAEGYWREHDDACAEDHWEEDTTENVCYRCGAPGHFVKSSPCHRDVYSVAPAIPTLKSVPPGYRAVFLVRDLGHQQNAALPPGVVFLAESAPSSPAPDTGSPGGLGQTYVHL